MTSSITGTEPVTLDGSFNLDLMGASTASGASWTLVSATGSRTCGTNNVTEFRLGLIPSSGSSRFRATCSRQRRTDDHRHHRGSSRFRATCSAAVLISWPSAEGVTFTVQRSTTQGSWTTIATVPGTAGTASYTDPAPPAGKAFYRGALQP